MRYTLVAMSFFSRHTVYPLSSTVPGYPDTYCWVSVRLLPHSRVLLFFTRLIRLCSPFISVVSWYGYFKSILDSATSLDTRSLRTRDSVASQPGRPRRQSATA